ncbi:MAG: WG repeat-containing protein [Alistipes sp.]
MNIYNIMKTKILLICATMFLVACGHSSGDGWKPDDLRCIPLVVLEDSGSRNEPDDPDNRNSKMVEKMVYVDLSTGKKTAWGSYDFASLFYDGYAIVQQEEAGYSFLDKDGHTLNEKPYVDATIFHDGVAWVVQPCGPLVAINKKGVPLFELKQAKMAFAFHEGVAMFMGAKDADQGDDTGFLCGLVDKKGNIVVEPRWMDVMPMVVNGMIAVMEAPDKWFLADKNGEKITDYFELICSGNTTQERFDNYAQALSTGRIPVKSSGKWGVINKKGTYIIDPQFDNIILDGENYLFQKADLCGWCDKNGQYSINPQFSGALPFLGQDLAPAQKEEDGLWGFINKTGIWVIDPQFRNAGVFHACGIAPAQDKETRKWGAIDKTGKWVINPQFKSMHGIGTDEKLFVVKDQSESVGVIDASGKYVVTPVFVSEPEMWRQNESGGMDPKCFAVSEFIDVEAIAALIDTKIHSLKKTTTGSLMADYGLKESEFPKNGDEITIDDESFEAMNMELEISVAGVNAWEESSNGWDYTFLPDVPIDSYIINVSLYGPAMSLVNNIVEELKKKYASNKEGTTLTIPGYSEVLVVIPYQGEGECSEHFSLHVKP